MQEKQEHGPVHGIEPRELGHCVYCAAETSDFCLACGEYICAECFPTTHPTE